MTLSSFPGEEDLASGAAGVAGAGAGGDGGGGGGEARPRPGESRARALEGTGEADRFGERARFMGGMKVQPLFCWRGKGWINGWTIRWFFQSFVCYSRLGRVIFGRKIINALQRELGFSLLSV